jgi:hypothetical protein
MRFEMREPSRSYISIALTHLIPCHMCQMHTHKRSELSFRPK